MYDRKLDEQQIAKVIGHKSVAVCNYKHTSLEKQWEVSDILYGKRKNPPSVTMTKEEANFDLAMNSQAEHVQSDVLIQPEVWINTAQVEIKEPIVNIQQPKITVSPVINLHAEQLSQNE